MTDHANKAATGAVQPERAVLFVDDEPDILELLRLYVEETLPNVRVHTAPSGPKALELLRAEPIDLVVSDFRMPLMDGIEFLARARDLQPGAERVLFTAYADHGLAERARRDAAVTAIYSKALDFPEMVRRVQALLAARPPTG